MKWELKQRRKGREPEGDMQVWGKEAQRSAPVPSRQTHALPLRAAVVRWGNSDWKWV